MSRPIPLTEWKSETVPLDVKHRDLIQDALPKASLSPVRGTAEKYWINPKNYVGYVKVGDISLIISPKIDVRRVMFLLTYSLDPKYWKDGLVDVKDDDTLNEAIARIFIRSAKDALRGGPLLGYRTVDDSIDGFKGRVRFDDQCRRHQRLAVPIEVTFDDLSLDIEENQLVLAAARKLRRLRRLDSGSDAQLRSIERSLAEVELKDFHLLDVPNPIITRLNRHYSPVLKIARLILQNSSIELGEGSSPDESLLFDMGVVFQNFVHTALAESLQLSPTQFPSPHQTELFLDHNEKIKLEPDLSWWKSNRCEFVGDVKYKSNTNSGNGHSEDIYQVLAYAIGAGLSSATLVYGQSNGGQLITHTTVNGVKVHIEALNLDSEPQQLLNEVDDLATRLKTRCAH